MVGDDLSETRYGFEVVAVGSVHLRQHAEADGQVVLVVLVRSCVLYTKEEQS